MRRRLLGLVAAGMLVVTACGTSSSSGSPAASAEPGATTAPAASAEASAAAGSADFRFAVDGEPTYFSPASNDLPSSWINALLYTGLYRINNEGVVTADLAVGDPVPSADGLTVTVKVRDDAKWHDGTPVTAEDVLFTYQIALSEKCSMNPTTCSTWHDNVASVTSPDASTIEIKLKAPYAPFYILGLASTIIVPKAATEASFERFNAGSGGVDAAAVKALADKIAAAQADAACSTDAPPPTCAAANYITEIEAQLTAAGIPLLDKNRYQATNVETGVTAPDPAAYADAANQQLTDLNTTLQAGATDKIAAAYRLLDINLAPVGSGAYKFGSYTPGQSVELVRNDDYYQFTPGPAKVLVPVIKAADAATDALASNNIDWQTEVTSSDSLAKLKADANTKLSEYPDLGYYYLAFNVREGHVFSDVVARQALAMCIDQQATVDVATEKNGVAVKAQVPPGSAFYNPDVPDYVHDVAGAKALLESNGYTLTDGVYAKGDNKLEATLYVRQGRPQRVKFAELARDQVAECGIKLNVNEADFAAVLLPLLDYPNNFDIYMGGWSNLFDPEDSNLFGCDHVTTKDNPVDNNFTGFCDPKVDELLAAAKAELDPVKRKAILAELQLLIHDVGPYYFTWADLGHKGYSAKVGTTGDLGPVDYTSFYDYWNNDSWTVAQ